MTKHLIPAMALLAVGIIGAVSCTSSDTRTAVIDVPEMSNATSVRIVTNAALDEVVGQYDGIRNAYEVDLERQLIIYHESSQLLTPAYQNLIRDRIAEVGFEAHFLATHHNPPPPVMTINGPCQMWPDRITSVLSVPTMTSNTDANIIVDAIAYARLGNDSPRISVEGAERRLVIHYESLQLSLKSIEQAIACAGFDANTTPARLGRHDAIPHGWTTFSASSSRAPRL